jgi:HSP20 family protein
VRPSGKTVNPRRRCRSRLNYPALKRRTLKSRWRTACLLSRGEKKTETEDKDRLFSERYYGRFERRIPLDDIDQDKIDASFKNGVLNVTLPKSPTAQQKVRRIAINNGK